MFKIKLFNPHPEGWRIVMAFNLPFGNTTTEIEEVHETKMKAMCSFASNANTMLDVRIEEFSMIIQDKVINHFMYKKSFPFYNDMQYLGFYWEWKSFLEKIVEKRNHRYEYAKTVKENIYLFKNIIPQYEGLKKYKDQLSGIIPEIESICKQIMEVARKIQKEYDNGI